MTQACHSKQVNKLCPLFFLPCKYFVWEYIPLPLSMNC
uniref:Uncharacterized protein n=1 Tax=Anguilla anguilla TaxID=7936 RepID=A0A0E9S6F0_ANGAN